MDKNRRFIIDMDEPRQHINLSTRAMKVIERDMIYFSGDFSIKNKSGYLNRIFKNYYEDFPLSPDHVLKDITKIHKSLAQDNIGKRIVEKIVDEFSMAIMEESIKQYSKNFENGEQFKFKFNKSNAVIFSQIEEAGYFIDYAPRSGQAFYLKMIFESYASLTRLEREEIYYKEEIKTLQRAIESNHKVRIKSKDEYEVIVPFKLSREIDQNSYHIEYLEPMKDDLLNQEVAISTNIMKLSQIEGISIDKTFNDTEKTILTMLRENELKVNLMPHHKSAKYKYDVKIKFTENGQWRYNLEEDSSMIIGLPVKGEKATYLFNATESEVFWEFFKYGVDAKIIEPNFLREKFAKFYQLAAKVYSEE
ncbi:MAG: WYL domain-containing protein [Acholeplasma sp.]|nr:MAG: WYL domain-containing protein [Acholeplasma sp.]